MQYLLDTVTISELRLREKAHPGVWKWQAGVGDIGISVVSLNEIRYGIKKVELRDPDFAARLTTWYANLIAQPERFRIQNVDRIIAETAADYRAAHDTPFEDSLIAATAKVHGLTLATRNTGDFEGLDIKLLNPWKQEGGALGMK